MLDPISKTIIVLAVGITPKLAYSLSCMPEHDQLARAEVLFSGMVTGIMLEPEGVGAPSAATKRLPIYPDMFDSVPAGEEVTIEGCNGLYCFTWSGSLDDLPATHTRSWALLYVEVVDVWRGNVGAKETIYIIGGQYPELGSRFVMGFYDDRVSPLSFEGPCQPLLIESDLKDFRNDYGPPIYSYPSQYDEGF